MMRDIVLMQGRKLEGKLRERYVVREGLPTDISRDLVKVANTSQTGGVLT